MEGLQATLPLPLAQLARRVASAGTEQARLDSLFYLGEAALKLAASARIGRLLALGPPPTPALATQLEGLMLPSMGHWLALLRETTKALSERPGAKDDPLASFTALSRARAELADVTTFGNAMSAEGLLATKSTVSDAAKQGVLGFFGLLTTFRNKAIGHGAQHVESFHGPMADALALALEGAFKVPELFGGLDLVLPQHRLAGSIAKTQLRVLRGLVASTREPSAGEWSVGELYFADDKGFRAPLSPLVIVRTTAGSEQFGFLNGADAKKKDAVSRAEYLDYTTSKLLKEVDVLAKLTELLALIRHHAVTDREVQSTIIALEKGEKQMNGSAAVLGAAIVGTVVADRYRVCSMIGAGAMGSVYEVEHVTLGTRHAMKVLHANLIRPEFLERFDREASETAKTKHPGIVSVTDHGGLPDGARYLVMEFLEGESLQRRLERAPLSIGDVVTLGSAALDALAAAHERGLVHRDLKPDNLYCPSTPSSARIKILDFGIAKSASDGRNLTSDNALLGTPNFMAPEQVDSTRDVDARADLYAIGATLFACLTQRSPAEGDTVHSLLFSVANGTIQRDPRIHRPDTPAALADVIVRSLQLAPSDRFQSALEMRMALEACGRNHDSEPASPTTPLELCATQAATVPGGPPVATLDPPQLAQAGSLAAPPARSRAVLVGVVGSLAAAGVTAAFVLRSSGPPGSSGVNSSPPLSASVSGALTGSAASAAVTPPSASPPGADSGAPPKGAVPVGMALVAGATFTMGLTEADLRTLKAALCGPTSSADQDCAALDEVFARSTPAQDVTVASFYLDRAEVSREQFARWLTATRSLEFVEGATRDRINIVRSALGPLAAVSTALHPVEKSGVRTGAPGQFGPEGEGALPMIAVTWLGAHEYCRSLGARLPTEAEWELAARGSKRTLFAGGDERPGCGDAVFAREGPRRGATACASQPDHLAGVLAPDRRSSGDLLHLGGNVSEWAADHVFEDASKRASYPRCARPPCADYYVGADGEPGPRPADDVIGTAESFHAIRGCSYMDPVERCVAAVRSYDMGFAFERDKGALNPHVGFRCARSEE